MKSRERKWGEVIFEGESLVDLSVDERARRGITLACRNQQGLKVWQKFAIH
jgi:Fe-S cluster assembly ATPase SufC